MSERWRPGMMPALRQKQHAACLAGAIQTRSMAAEIAASGLAVQNPSFRHHAEESGEMLRRFALEAQMWAAAEMWWVTAEMTALALEASATLPDWSPAAVFPAGSGFIMWEGGLPEVDIPEIDGIPGSADRAAVVACLWYRDPQIPLWMNIEVLGRAAAGGSVPLDNLFTLMVNAETGLMLGPSHAELPATSHSLLHMLGATLLLAQQERTATITLQRPVPKAVRRAARAKMVSGPVRLVDLAWRATTAAQDEPSESTGRHLTNRHIVRGHWTQQVWGPKRSLRKPLWIDAFVKGPADAPLITRDRVLVWRR